MPRCSLQSSRGFVRRVGAGTAGLLAWPYPCFSMRPARAMPRCRPALRPARGPDGSGAVLLPSPRPAKPLSRVGRHFRNTRGMVMPARRSARRRNQKKGRKNMGRTQQHAKTDVVIAVVRVIPVADATARIVPVIVPRAAAHDLSRLPGRMSPPGARRLPERPKKNGPRCARSSSHFRFHGSGR